jgi:D-alanyl-D-alanine carboxypeptidase
MRWAIYLVIALAIFGVGARVATRAVALAHNAALTQGPLSSATPSPPLRLATATAPLVATRTPTPIPPTFTPTSTPSPTPTPTLNPTEISFNQALCALYDQVPPELLVRVDKDTPLPRDYEPPDLQTAPLDEKNVGFRAVPLRPIVHRPLLDMIDAMNQAGLSVWVASGYRSYSDQKLAYDKWVALYPDRAPEISAVPGHSEHQLGTSVDFTTPYMDDLYGDFFNVRFANTPEGEWLKKQAAYYGFALSYPENQTGITGYAWEPWHFRYVGLLALDLQTRNMTLTEYIRHCGPENVIATTPTPEP